MWHGSYSTSDGFMDPSPLQTNLEPGNIPGEGEREREKPRDCDGNDPEPFFHGRRFGNDLLCLARSGGSGALQHSLGSRRMRGILCPWKPGHAWRKAGAELPKPPRAALKGNRTQAELAPEPTISQLIWATGAAAGELGEGEAETALPILFHDPPAARSVVTALIFGGEAPPKSPLCLFCAQNG